jgi:hypothetical protein
MEAGEVATAGLPSIGKPIADVVAPHSLVDWQQAFDPLLDPGARNYWKSHDLTDLSDAMIEILTAAVRRFPGPSFSATLSAGRIAAYLEYRGNLIPDGSA